MMPFRVAIPASVIEPTSVAHEPDAGNRADQRHRVVQHDLQGEHRALKMCVENHEHAGEREDAEEGNEA